MMLFFATMLFILSRAVTGAFRAVASSSGGAAQGYQGYDDDAASCG
eukprot:CAMPEP_0179886850 /NCGR_PEP_ID=MMETSP0982-20121206/31083_1 /TAXON_ID=483367 /ORGANISM="non described non described, Strain CCMP 2436" /LENGTH=45 /DNA_ID= /DNA_START= /DNA_END= /DNA_ORIENTATION=